MADTYTPEEIDEIFGAYNRAIKDGTPITADLTRQMKDAATGVKNYTANLNNSLKGLGNSALKLADQIKDGAQGAAVFNDSINATATVLDNFLSRFGVLGRMLGTAITAGAKYASEANKQGDALFKSYQDLTRFGQGTARGMSDVFDTMQKFSYGIGELDQMTALLRDNAKNLALFGGTVAQGTDALANTSAQFRDSGLQDYFRRMGMDVDTQNRAIAGYIKQLGMLGQTQGKTQNDLTQGAAAYLREIEGLTRLTGQNREELEQQREAAMRVDQFAVTVQDLGKQGKELQKVFNILNSIDPKYAQAFAESSTGFLTGSAEQTQLFQLSGGRLLSLMDQLKTGAINAGQFVDALKPTGNQLELFKNMARVPGQLAGFAGSYSSVIKLTNKSWEQSAEAADRSIEVTDETTDASVDLRKKQMQTRDALQSMIHDGVLPATQAMAKLAGITDQAAEGSKGFWDKVGDFFSGDKNKVKSDSDLDKLLGAIRKVESGSIAGNYKIKSPSSSASGAYQFLDKTWQEQTKKQNLGTEYRRAADAPKEIQDAVAKTFIKELLRINKGDIDAVLNQYFTGDPRGKMNKQQLDANSGLDSGGYRQRAYNALKEQGGLSSGSTSTNNTLAGTTPNAPLGMANGFEGFMSGPKSGYRPNIIMHGTESIKVTPENQLGQSTTPVHSALSQQTAKLDQMVQALQDSNGQEMMMMQLDKLDRLIHVMQNQVNISQKILQQSH